MADFNTNYRKEPNYVSLVEVIDGYEDCPMRNLV
jgi:hypothetical protein